MNFSEEIERLRLVGYSETNAQARLCQDIILQGIASSRFSKSVTIKGGVVMRNLSGSARRATRDIDIDFIRYSLDDVSIDRFVSSINVLPGIKLERTGTIETLNQQDYKGKRIHVLITDAYGNSISSKVDLGVHADLTLKQSEFCFDICFAEDGASLLINTPAQMITEKLKSLMRFGAQSTRFKDIFDIYFLFDKADKAVLKECIAKYIYDDRTLAVNNIEDILSRLSALQRSKTFLTNLNRSDRNWIGIDAESILREIIDFLKYTL